MTTLILVPGGISEGRGLWVADDESEAFIASGTRLLHWTPAAGVSVYASDFVQLGNLAVTSSGGIVTDLVVTDLMDHRVLRIDPSGHKTIIAGNGTTKSTGGTDVEANALEAGLDEARAVWRHRQCVHRGLVRRRRHPSRDRSVRSGRYRCRLCPRGRRLLGKLPSRGRLDMHGRRGRERLHRDVRRRSHRRRRGLRRPQHADRRRLRALPSRARLDLPGGRRVRDGLRRCQARCDQGSVRRRQHRRRRRLLERLRHGARLGLQW